MILKGTVIKSITWGPVNLCEVPVVVKSVSLDDFDLTATAHFRLQTKYDRRRARLRALREAKRRRLCSQE